MSQALVQVYLHVVFSTKHRKPFFQERGLRQRVHAYLVGVCRNLGCCSLQIGGVEDHVHLLCQFGRGLALQDFVRDMKRESSKWAKTQHPSWTDFHWQLGYGAFSISPSHAERLTQYIANQETHHCQETFQDEFRRLCRRYGMELDERHAWD